MAWFGFIELRGLDGKLTRKSWQLQVAGADGAAFTAALAAIDAIKNALDPVTQATTQDVGVTYAVPEYQVGLGILEQQALINVWAEDPDNATDVLALSQIYIPAPVIGIMVATTGPNMKVVDVNDTDLQAYVDALSTYAYISDMEVIDTGAGTGGIENGRRITRKGN